MAKTNWAQAANMLIPSLPSVRRNLNQVNKGSFTEGSRRIVQMPTMPKFPDRMTKRPYDPAVDRPPHPDTFNPYNPAVDRPPGPDTFTPGRLPRLRQVIDPLSFEFGSHTNGPAPAGSGFTSAAQAVTGPAVAAAPPAASPLAATTAAAPVVTRNSVVDNPFWRPNNGYGGRDIGGEDPQAARDWYNDFISRYDEDGRELINAEWERFLTNEGFGGFDRRSQWGRSLFSRMVDGYEAASQSNPELHVREYLAGLRGYLQDAYANLSQGQRGLGIPSQARTIFWN